MMEFYYGLAELYYHVIHRETNLERMGKRVLLPVRGIIGELDLTLEMDVDVIQPGKIKRLANDVSLSLGQVQSTTLVGLLETIVELGRDIIQVIVRRPDGEAGALGIAWCLVRVLVTELVDAPGNSGWKLQTGGNGAYEEERGREISRDLHLDS